MKKLIALSAIAILGGGALYAQGQQNKGQNNGFGGCPCFGGGSRGGGRGMMGGGYGMMQDENVARAVMASQGMKEADIAKMLQLRKEASGIMDKYNQPASTNK